MIKKKLARAAQSHLARDEAARDESREIRRDLQDPPARPAEAKRWEGPAA